MEIPLHSFPFCRAPLPVPPRQWTAFPPHPHPSAPHLLPIGRYAVWDAPAQVAMCRPASRSGNIPHNFTMYLMFKFGKFASSLGRGRQHLGCCGCGIPSLAQHMSPCPVAEHFLVGSLKFHWFSLLHRMPCITGGYTGQATKDHIRNKEYKAGLFSWSDDLRHCLSERSIHYTP